MHHQTPYPTSNEIRLNENDFIVSKTDQSGRITYGNKHFIKISGYHESELIGSAHSILRHPDMPKVVFKLLWETIKKKEEIFAYVKNLAKDGSYYWVFANVTCTYSEAGILKDYHSVRRRPSDQAMKVIPDLYRQLHDAEQRGGVSASEKMLHTILTEKGLTYHDFVLRLQK